MERKVTNELSALLGIKSGEVIRAKRHSLNYLITVQEELEGRPDNLRCRLTE